MDAPLIRAKNGNRQSGDLALITTSRKISELLQHEPTDRVELFSHERGFEVLVEIVNGRTRLYEIVTVSQLLAAALVVRIVLVIAATSAAAKSGTGTAATVSVAIGDGGSGE